VTTREQTTHRSRTSTPPGRRAFRRVVRAAALACAAAFAGGTLLTQTAIVPFWRALDPAAFLESFATYGPVIGATLFPVELLSVALLAVVVYSTVRDREPGRLLWIGALVCMGSTVLLLPLYFAGANTAFLRGNVTVDEVADALATWNAWNWLRTGLAVASVVLICAGIAYQEGGEDPAAPGN
jgi:hypothetical protein